MRLLEYFFQWQKADKRPARTDAEAQRELDYIRGLDRGIEIGLKFSTHVDRMALDMARAEGIEEILKRFNESGYKTNN